MGTEVARDREQPESDRVWSIETNGINAIPDQERHGRPVELFWIWFAANVSILGMFFGLALVTFYGLSLPQALVAGVLGTVLSFTLVGLISLAGKRGGAPTLTLSRAPFGVVGNALPTLVSYLALVGWETILIALASLAAQAILDRLGVGGGDVSLAIAFAVVAAAAIAIGLLGHATIVKLMTWFTWAFGALTPCRAAPSWPASSAGCRWWRRAWGSAGSMPPPTTAATCRTGPAPRASSAGRCSAPAWRRCC
jgi:NCS1 family nucleobase:cation symporter-1